MWSYIINTQLHSTHSWMISDLQPHSWATHALETTHGMGEVDWRKINTPPWPPSLVVSSHANQLSKGFKISYKMEPWGHHSIEFKNWKEHWNATEITLGCSFTPLWAYFSYMLSSLAPLAWLSVCGISLVWEIIAKEFKNDPPLSDSVPLWPTRISVSQMQRPSIEVVTLIRVFLSLCLCF